MKKLSKVLSNISLHEAKGTDSEYGFLIIMTISLMQYFGIMLSKDGYGTIMYDENTFSKFYVICRASLLIIDGTELYWLIAIAAFNIFVFFAFLTLLTQKSIELGNLWVSFIQSYWTLLQTILYLPQLSILFHIIQFTESIEVQIAIVVIVLLGAQILISPYVIRCHTLEKTSQFVKKFNYLDYIPLILSILALSIYDQKFSEALTFIQLIILALFSLVEGLKFIFSQPYSYSDNRIGFQFSCIKLTAAILQIVTVGSDNKYFPNGFHFLSQLIFGTLAYNIAGKLYEMRYDNLGEIGISYPESLYMIDKIIFLSTQTKKSPSSIYAAEFTHNLVQHRNKCTKKMCLVDNQLKLYKNIISCIFMETLKKYDFEALNLLYVNFLRLFCHQPMLALMHLRKYEMRNASSSFYYKLIYQELCKQINKQIELQNLVNGLDKSKVGSLIVSPSEIIDFLTMEGDFMRSIMRIIDNKVLLWQSQIKGYNSIYDFKEEVLNVSQRIQAFTDEAIEQLDVDLHKSKLEYSKISTLSLKLISLYYAVVMNNYNQSLICELHLHNVMSYEAGLPADTLTSLSALNGRVQVITVSLLKNLGAILNTNKQEVLEFFNYQKEQAQQINYINALMPQFIAQRHNQLILGFLQDGHSILLTKFRTVFAKCRKGFIFPLQLKLNNNFTDLSDFIIQGFLFKINAQAEYILFDDFGKLLGISESFWNSIIVENNVAISLEYLQSHCYIFLLIPQITKTLQQLASNKAKNNNTMDVEDEIVLFMRQDLKDFLFQFSDKVVQRNVQMSKSKQNSQGGSEANESQQWNNQLNYSYNSNKSEMSRLYQNQTSLVDEGLYATVQEYFNSKHNSGVMYYNIRFFLNHQTIGRGTNKESFYQLQITDFRRIDSNQASSFGSNYFKSYASKCQSLLNNPSSHQKDQKTNSVETNYQVLAEGENEQLKNQKLATKLGKQWNDSSYYISKYDAEKQHQLPDQSNFALGSDSLKHSMSCGPVSQRAHFISPFKKHDIIEDNELLELELQFQSARSGEYHNQMLQPDQQSEDKDDDKVGQVNSNSLNKENPSNQILKVIIQHKQQDYDVDANQSRSTTTSKTSGTSASELVRSFQRGNIMTNNVCGIVSINAIIFGGLFMIMIIHIVQLQGYHDATVTNNQQLNGPYDFNRYFTKAIQLSWVIISQALGVINSSEFSKLKMLTEIKLLSQNTFENMTNLYSTFIDIENRGLMQEVTISDIKIPPENSTYTKFAGMMQNNAFTVFQAANLTPDDYELILTAEYLDAVLFLRYNLKNIYFMNTQLLNSLFTIFYQNLSDQESNLLTQVLLEISLVGIIMGIQIQFWKNLERHNQLILLLLGKMQEADAENQILLQLILLKNQQIKQILQLQSGKHNWKLRDFYQICFLGFRGKGGDDQILEQPGVKHSIKYAKGKGNRSQSLNARINNSKIKLYVHALLVFLTFFSVFLYLFGGFLLFQSQQQAIFPTQQLSNQFIQFSSQLDVLMTAATIIKTQPQIYDKLVQQNIYTQEKVKSIIDGNRIFVVFKELVVAYAASMMKIFKGIVLSDLILPSDQQRLYNLYQGNYCLMEITAKNMQFCQLDNLGVNAFISLYGQFSEDDDNSVFLSKGIIGIVSVLQTLFNENFEYEIQNSTYLLDVDKIYNFLHTKLFNNAVMSHFTDTFWGIMYFLQTIQDSISTIMTLQLRNIIVYFIVLGTVIIVVNIIVYWLWIRRARQQMRQLRLAILLLPIEILTNPQTLSTIKKLQ